MENNSNSIGKFSIGCNGVSPSLVIIDWSKKRKLEDEQLTLPLSKVKCITQSSGRLREAALSFEQQGIESNTGTCNQKSMYGSKDCDPKSMLTDVLSPTDSGGGYTKLVTWSGDSSSCTGSNNSFGDFRIRMPFGSQDEIKQSSFSEDSDGSTFRENLYSLDSRTITRKSKDSEKEEKTELARKESNSPTKLLNCIGVLDREVDVENLNECLDDETEFSYSGYDQLLDLGISYDELIDFEACRNTDNDTSLYFSDAPSPIYLLSSGGSNGQGSVKCERKPTIDQEFEQYFSSLML
ncbi:uncharacterized protein LOC116255580 [Nymphaea colorata]|nr:uncharacterized protein LOC116255580 [Nymphaea colorata]